jgi:hypothetical protein
MNILEIMKGYIMGRPPGAKNKKNMETVMNEETKVFNYEDELQNQGMVPAWREVNVANEPVNNVSQTVPASYFNNDDVNTGANMQSNLFLVEGLVQLRPLQPGRQPVQAEQNRIVYANDIDHAIQKYNQYFASLSNGLEMYVVLRASASEAIM